MPFRLFLKPSTAGLDWQKTQVKVESLALHDGTRAFDRPRPMPYVERNFRGYRVPLNP
jgi:hypothetical protein